ncbi:MAG: YegS/Rv2252/BmrU family lipid kinase [Ruminococcaceae bacterium]|nr:YegS/Rv2252/BmrU family lipid kinase [Oscillospiraceae bacterium]
MGAAMKKLLFIINPVTAKAILSPHLIDVMDVFVKGGYDVTTYITQDKDDAARISAQRGGEFDAIVCAGGDGTLNGVITGILDLPEKPRLGYIPAGTTNDFANSWGIPRNPLDAAKNIVSEAPSDIDVSVFCGRPFIYVAAFGIFTAASYQTPQEAKQRFGRTAYLFEGIKSLASVRPWHMKIIHDGGEIEDDFIYGMVSNTRMVGGFPLRMKEDISISDGKMELILIRQPKNPGDQTKMIAAVLAQDTSSEHICFVHTSRITFMSEEEIPWTVDGEFGGSVTEGEAYVRGKAISMTL